MKKYSIRSPIENFDTIEEEDNLGEWIHENDFYIFIEKLENSINKYTDEKGLISSKFVKIAIDRCIKEKKDDE